MDSGLIFENREKGRSVNVCFRLFRQGDGEQFCRCIEDFYGGGYPYKEYLDEEFLLEKCAAGEMTVLCGVTPEDWKGAGGAPVSLCRGAGGNLLAICGCDDP